jgi:hypothetical protein
MKTIIWMAFFTSVTFCFAFANEVKYFRKSLLELKPLAMNISPDTLFIQKIEYGSQYDYFWPAKNFSMELPEFFAITSFPKKVFKSESAAILTLEYLQGVSLESQGYQKSQPIPAPTIKNCNHHEVIHIQTKVRAYTLACIGDEKAFLILSSFPMAIPWISSLYRR